MEYLIILLKANLILSICYLIYRIWFRKLTFYQLNRFYFLSAFAIAIISPFLQIKMDASQPVEKIKGNISFEELQRLFAQRQQASEQIYWFNIITTIYLCGLIVMGIIFLIKLVSLTGIYLQSKNFFLDGRKIKVPKNATAPFSFFNTIFINKNAIENNQYQLILDHETIHVNQYHSIDVLLSEVFKVISWFNPIVWFLQRSLRENLEYIADQKVLALGVDAKIYQYNLLSGALYTQNVSITNHYNFSHLKNRMIMMNKDKSTNFQLVKYLLALPFVLLISICAQRSNAQITPQISEQSNKDRAAITPTVVTAKNKQGRLETNKASDKMTQNIKKKSTKNTPRNDRKEEDVAFKITDDEDGSEKTNIAKGEEPINTKETVVLLDGKEIFDMNSVDPNTIEKMSVHKGVSCQMIYPQYPNAKSIVDITSKKN